MSLERPKQISGAFPLQMMSYLSGEKCGVCCPATNRCMQSGDSETPEFLMRGPAKTPSLCKKPTADTHTCATKHNTTKLHGYFPYSSGVQRAHWHCQTRNGGLERSSTSPKICSAFVSASAAESFSSQNLPIPAGASIIRLHALHTSAATAAFGRHTERHWQPFQGCSDHSSVPWRSLKTYGLATRAEHVFHGASGASCLCLLQLQTHGKTHSKVAGESS